MKRLLGALGFLTVAPLPARLRGDGAALGRSVVFFPVVGLAIGVAVGGLDAALRRCLPVSVATVFTVIALVAVSGGLHLDGLADTADGFFSSRPRQRILEIMKDSRSGPLGVAAVVLVVALKLAVIGALPADLRWRALVLVPLAGRSGIVASMMVLHYARPEGGLGTAFAARRPWGALLLSLALLGVVGFWADGTRGLVGGAASLGAALLLSVYAQRKIGGWTGDTLGATCEVVEVVPALVLLLRFAEVP
jgi:adenosylcobinamide-GDP ribazoletransferase